MQFKKNKIIEEVDAKNQRNQPKSTTSVIRQKIRL